MAAPVLIGSCYRFVDYIIIFIYSILIYYFLVICLNIFGFPVSIRLHLTYFKCLLWSPKSKALIWKSLPMEDPCDTHRRRAI